MKTLVNRRQGLTGVNIRASRDPYCLETRVIKHLFVVVIDSDVKIFVILVRFGPGDFMFEGAAYCDHSDTRDSVEKSMDVSLALRMS
jgi:hypothetical protein